MIIDKREAANRYEQIADSTMTWLLVAAAVAILLIAFFAPPWAKALALAYVTLP